MRKKFPAPPGQKFR